MVVLGQTVSWTAGFLTTLLLAILVWADERAWRAQRNPAVERAQRRA